MSTNYSFNETSIMNNLKCLPTTCSTYADKLSSSNLTKVADVIIFTRV